MVGDSPALEKTLLALLLASLRGLGQKEQIIILDRAGFGQKEIASVIGSTPKAVSVRLAEMRRHRASKAKK